MLKHFPTNPVSSKPAMLLLLLSRVFKGQLLFAFILYISPSSLWWVFRHCYTVSFNFPRNSFFLFSTFKVADYYSNQWQNMGISKSVFKIPLSPYTMLRTDNIAWRKFCSLFLNIIRRWKGRETQNRPNSSFAHNFCHWL